MKRTLTMLVLLASTMLAAQEVTVATPAYSSARLARLTAAIGAAEGFGIRGTLPSRYHNPGDLKGRPETFGAARVGKGGHLIFRTDAEGQAALRQQLELVLAGRSKYYTLDMTIDRMARRYAANWQNWARYVSKELGVPIGTTLRSYLCTVDTDRPPVLRFTEDIAWRTVTPVDDEYRLSTVGRVDKSEVQNETN